MLVFFEITTRYNSVVGVYPDEYAGCLVVRVHEGVNLEVEVEAEPGQDERFERLPFDWLDGGGGGRIKEYLLGERLLSHGQPAHLVRGRNEIGRVAMAQYEDGVLLRVGCRDATFVQPCRIVPGAEAALPTVENRTPTAFDLIRDQRHMAHLPDED